MLLLCVPPFSVWFWFIYGLGGVSDAVDGPIARKLKQVSDKGAKLDSVADFTFLSAVFIVVLFHVTISIWVWVGVGCIACIRILTYGIGFIKFKTYSSLHTYLNKVTGVLLFIMPLLIYLFGIGITAGVLCAIAGLSALEEMMIILRSKELKRDCRSFFSR